MYKLQVRKGQRPSPETPPGRGAQQVAEPRFFTPCSAWGAEGLGSWSYPF